MLKVSALWHWSFSRYEVNTAPLGVPWGLRGWYTCSVFASYLSKEKQPNGILIDYDRAKDPLQNPCIFGQSKVDLLWRNAQAHYSWYSFWGFWLIFRKFWSEKLAFESKAIAYLESVYKTESTYVCVSNISANFFFRRKIRSWSTPGFSQKKWIQTKRLYYCLAICHFAFY